jgi:hypothetical protein
MVKNVYFAGNPSKYDKAKVAKEIMEALEDMPKLGQEIVSKRDRPYNGSWWTDDGERGQTEVSGLTIRDIRDCLILAFFDSCPPEYKKVNDVEKLPLQEMSPEAISQNLSCWIERYMGIFPNITRDWKTGK